MKTARQIAADPRFACSVVAAALALSPVLATAQPLVSDATQIATWALALIKALAVIFIIGGFIMLASGRHWGGALTAVLGVIGAAKADTIATYLGL